MDAIEIKNRCVGAILGFAIGDAIGMPAEFLSREEIKRCYGKPISTFIRAHPGHANDFLSPGSYTDNTQVMLTTAECLIECRKMDPARNADALLSWHKNNAPHRSRSCGNLLLFKTSPELSVKLNENQSDKGKIKKRESYLGKGGKDIALFRL